MMIESLIEETRNKIKELGRVHPDVLECKKQIDEYCKNKYDNYSDRVYYIFQYYEKAFGKIDIDTIEAQRDLALDCLSIGWHSQFDLNYAFSEKNRYILYKTHLGENHPDTVKVKESMGETWVKEADAEIAFEQAKKTLGVDHPNAQKELMTIIECLKGMGLEHYAKEYEELLES